MKENKKATQNCQIKYQYKGKEQVVEIHWDELPKKWVSEGSECGIDLRKYHVLVFYSENKGYKTGLQKLQETHPGAIIIYSFWYLIGRAGESWGEGIIIPKDFNFQKKGWRFYKTKEQKKKEEAQERATEYCIKKDQFNAAVPKALKEEVRIETNWDLSVWHKGITSYVCGESLLFFEISSFYDAEKDSFSPGIRKIKEYIERNKRKFEAYRKIANFLKETTGLILCEEKSKIYVYHPDKMEYQTKEGTHRWLLLTLGGHKTANGKKLLAHILETPSNLVLYKLEERDQLASLISLERGYSRVKMGEWMEEKIMKILDQTNILVIEK